MEKDKRRGRILKPIKNLRNINNKNIIFNLNWWELLLNIVLIIIFIFFELFWNTTLYFKIILFCACFIILLSWDVKVNNKNIYYFLFSFVNRCLELKDTKNQEFIDMNLMQIQDDEIFFNNLRWKIKEISINNNFKYFEEQLETDNKQNLQGNLNCFIFASSFNFDFSNYLEKIYKNDDIDKNDYLKDYADNIKQNNSCSFKNKYFIFYNEENNIEYLDNLGIFDFHKISQNDVSFLKKKLTKLENYEEKKYIFHANNQFSSIFYCNELGNLNQLSWLINLFRLNLEYDCVIYMHPILKNEGMKILENNKKSDFFINKVKKVEVENHNLLIQEYQKILNADEINLFSVSVTYFLNDKKLDNLLHKISLLKDETNKLDINLTLIKSNFFFFFNFSYYMKNRYVENIITNDQLNYGFVSTYQQEQTENGIILGKDKFNYPFFYDQESYINTKSKNYLNGISLILGKSGSGKSLLLKKISVLSALINHETLIIFDVDNEFSTLTKIISNSMVFKTLPTEIDPFSLKFESLSEQIFFLNSFIKCFSSVNVDFTQIIYLYLKQKSNNFWDFIRFMEVNNPEKFKFINILKNEIYKKWFCKEFNKYDEYTLLIFNFKNIFDNELNLKDEFIKASLILIFSFVSNIIFRQRKNFVHLVVEEAYKFFNIKLPLLNDIWFSIIKKSRKYKTLLTFCTQNFDDLYLNVYAQKIMQNVQFVFAGTLNSTEANNLLKIFNLTNQEKDIFIEQINNLKKGEFLYSNNHQQFITMKNIISKDEIEKYYENKNAKI